MFFQTFSSNLVFFSVKTVLSSNCFPGKSLFSVLALAPDAGLARNVFWKALSVGCIFAPDSMLPSDCCRWHRLQEGDRGDPSFSSLFCVSLALDTHLLTGLYKPLCWAWVFIAWNTSGLVYPKTPHNVLSASVAQVQVAVCCS